MVWGKANYDYTREFELIMLTRTSENILRLHSYLYFNTVQLSICNKRFFLLLLLLQDQIPNCFQVKIANSIVITTAILAAIHI